MHGPGCRTVPRAEAACLEFEGVQQKFHDVIRVLMQEGISVASLLVYSI